MTYKVQPEPSAKDGSGRIFYGCTFRPFAILNVLFTNNDYIGVMKMMLAQCLPILLVAMPVWTKAQTARRIVAAGEQISVYNPLTRTFQEIGAYGRAVDMAVRDSTLFFLTSTSLRTVNLETGTTLNVREGLTDARRLALDDDGGVWVTHIGAKIRDFRGLIVAAGGVFGENDTDNVTLGFYDGVEYVVLDRVNEQSVQDVVFEAPFVYLTAQNRIVKYDLNLGKRVAEVEISGVRRLAVAGDYLICGLWFGAAQGGGYLKVLKKDDLSVVHTFADVDDETNGLAVEGTKLFVSVPGGFMATTGKILEIDLNALSVTWTLPLGEDGAGLGNFVRFGNEVWALCGGSGKLLRLVPATREYELIPAELSLNSYSSTWYVNDSLWALSTGPGVALYNVRSRTWFNQQFLNFSPAALLSVPDSRTIFATVTDYFSYGLTYVLDASGAKVDSFSVGVSPEALALDGRPVREYLTKFSDKLMPVESIANVPEPATGVAVAGGKVRAAYPGYLYGPDVTLPWMADADRLFSDGVRIAGAGTGQMAVFDGTTTTLFDANSSIVRGLFLRSGTLWAAFGATTADFNLNNGAIVASNRANFAPVAGTSVGAAGDYYLVRTDGACVRFAPDGSVTDNFGAGIELVAVQYGEPFDDTTQVSRSELFSLAPPYPNPCRDKLFLPVPTNGEIFDVLGRKRDEFVFTNTLDVAHLPPGMYFVRTSNGAFSFRKAGL
jgi:hypothetical protein